MRRVYDGNDFRNRIACATFPILLNHESEVLTWVRGEPGSGAPWQLLSLELSSGSESSGIVGELHTLAALRYTRAGGWGSDDKRRYRSLE
jgi:hypothetical protein